MQKPKPTRFLLVEDQKLLRELLLAHLREAYLGCEVTEVATMAELTSLRSMDSFTLGIVDLELPDGNSLDWVVDWVKRPSEPKAIVLSSTSEDYVLFRAQHSGMQGFVHKDDGTEVLHDAIHKVVNGGMFFSEIVQQMRSRMQSDPSFFNKILSEREQKLLEYLGQGLNNEDVARALGLSASTIADHRKRIMAKLGIHSQVELVRFAVRKGFSRI